MMETLFSLGGLTISTFGAFAALALLVFSYVSWQSLRDDFEEEKVLSLTIALAFSFLLGARALYILTHFGQFGVSFSWFLPRRFPGFSLLGGVLTGVFALYLWTRENDWDFWLVADAVTVSFSSSLFLLSLGIFISRVDEASFFLLAFSLLFFGAVLFFAQSYRKFIWYKSGKPGFVASICLSLFSLGYLVVEFLIENVILYSWENLGFFLLVFVGFSFLYKRSERVLREDLKRIVEAFSKASRKKGAK